MSKGSNQGKQVKPHQVLTMSAIPEGLAAGLMLAALPLYVPFLLAYLAFASYCFLRIGWSNFLGYVVFWLSSWLGSIVFTVWYSNVRELEILLALGLDSGMLVMACILVLLTTPYFRERPCTFGWPIKVFGAAFIGVLFGLGTERLGGLTITVFLLAILGGLVTQLFGDRTKHVLSTFVFALAYAGTLFLVMDGLPFIRYNAYECALMFSAFLGPVTVGVFLPVLLDSSNGDVKSRLGFKLRQSSERRCPQCGLTAASGDRFCGSCGGSLEQGVNK